MLALILYLPVNYIKEYKVGHIYTFSEYTLLYTIFEQY